MTFTIQHYSDAPILILECPNPLDFYRGIQAAQREIIRMRREDSANDIYWVIYLHNIGPFFEMFAKWLTELSIYGRGMLMDPRIHTMVITSPELADEAIERFNSKPFHHLSVPVFDSLDDALKFCYVSLAQAS
jgi:hypothetical protein